MWILSPFSIFCYILILQDHVTACLSVFHGFSLFCLYSVLLLLLFCKERTADDDSVPCSVQCLESKRLRFIHQTVLFCFASVHAIPGLSLSLFVLCVLSLVLV